MPTEATVGGKISFYRNKSKYTIDKLAAVSAISRDSILRYENSDTEATIENLNTIADALSINADKLCDEYYQFLLYPYSKKIKEMRKALSLTQKEFCKIYEIKLHTLKRWEQERCVIDREQWRHNNSL